MPKGTGQSEPIAWRRLVAAFDVETLPDPAIVVSATGYVCTLNASAEALVGHRAADLVGRPAHVVLALDDDQQDPFSTTLRVRRAGVTLHRKGGHEIHTDALLCPDLATDAVVIVLRAFGCTGARREDELAAIGHDMRGPLGVVALEVELLADTFAAVQGSRVAQALARIGRNVAVLDAMLHDLMELTVETAPTSGEAPAGCVDLAQIAEEVVDRMVSSRDRSRVTIDATGRAVVMADGPRIGRVIGNLVHNALKYSGSDGRIHVRVEASDGRAYVSVADSGPGLTPDESALVFERFSRAGPSRDHDGLGLGLYISRRIVEAYGGRIGVDSAVDRGSRFYFDLALVR